MKNKLVAERAALQAEADTLGVTFSENESELAQLEEKLRLETGSLGELFGVGSSKRKELEAELKHSVTGVDANTFQQNIDDIVAAKSCLLCLSFKRCGAVWKNKLKQVVRWRRCHSLCLMVKVVNKRSTAFALAQWHYWMMLVT